MCVTLVSHSVAEVQLVSSQDMVHMVNRKEFKQKQQYI